MNAWLYDHWGGPDMLRLAQLTPGPMPQDAVRIEVAYAGVNPVDCKVLSGKYRLLARGGFPRRIGVEGSGRIVETGPGVTGLEPGMNVVYGLDPMDGRQGSWAERVDVPALRVLPVPDGISLREAAVLPIAALTAWQMCGIADVQRDREVLVTGASGGVGHVAVQIAKDLGAHVTATGSERNRAMIESFGADAILDYRAAPPERNDRRWDAVLDCVNSLRAVSGTILKPAGHYVDTDPQPLTLLANRVRNAFGSRKRHTVMVDIEPSGMRSLFQLLATRRLRPFISREFPLEGATDAIRESLAGHVVGKLVIKAR